MIVLSIIQLVIGFLLLVKGADAFVDGASSIARRMRIPAFVVGLTIVAFGTSAPELAVSLTASLKGSNDIAIGNVVGSNIFNTLVVLGASAAITPIVVQKGMIKRDYPLSIIAAVLLGALSLNMMLGRGDGVVLLVAFAFFMFMTVKVGLKERANSQDEEEAPKMSTVKAIIMLILGLVGIIWGGDSTVEGAKAIASSLGLSEALIGLTVVALGTSLPELVTSVVAARKGESDIAVGNVIGSNIFNIFLILGISATISPMNVTQTYLYDMAVLALIMVLTFIPIAVTKKVSRWMGITMIMLYVGYTAYLVYAECMGMR